jgi:hypothetical protein
VWLLASFILSVLIAIAVVVRRTVALIFPAAGGSARVAAIDATFAAHKVLTLLHILPQRRSYLSPPRSFSEDRNHSC